MSKRIAILGSTGSIGTNTLRVIEALGADYCAAALTAHNNVELLAQQTKKYEPGAIALTNPDRADELYELLKDYKGTIFVGHDSLEKIAALNDIDIFVTAIVGAAGLPAVLKAAEKGRTLAIANKEPFVIAGKLLTETAKQNNTTIIPIDSEHSAIFQCLQAGKTDEVNKIILTASGGPFRGATKKQLQSAGLEEALRHPTWKMGPKITVDSATMMNKALEVIEAVWLFGLDPDKIEIIVHPESVVHSLVEFIDGSVIAQLGTPDMCVPIQYALTYPDRRSGVASFLKLEELGRLTFEKPNLETFRALSLGYEVAKLGGSAPVVFNAANEAAVAQFLDGKIKFAQIIELIEHCLNKHTTQSNISLDQLLQTDTWAREQVLNCIEKHPQNPLRRTGCVKH